MKAAICTKYGSPEVIKIENIQKPTPKDNEILIRIITTTVQTGDCKLRDLIGVNTSKTNYNPVVKFLMRVMMGYNRPKNPIFGTELYGRIESVGKKVTKHKVDDEVIVMTDVKMGAHAEYIAWPESKLIISKPNGITSEQAAALSFGGTTALCFLRKAGIRKGQTILINGASGAVGSSTVQIAKYFGAVVTGVCGTNNIELVKSIGADYVVDYTQEVIGSGNIQYDIIFDAVGKTTKNNCKNILKPKGKYITVLSGIAMGKQKDLIFLKRLVEQNKYKVIIDKCYRLEEIIEAYKYVETGHKKGNVIIKL
ncbi:MAG: NAD(P)-dependent alcohol dehydrogenase [Treponema sp.]|jgi:NADPH:quinone reductase-like Zn-dependent oxidoreductase|nr:NAD(P)-dependent alcohol dehydrogenase [Treponema sp.]